jgi:hypothetical protein
MEGDRSLLGTLHEGRIVGVDGEFPRRHERRRGRLWQSPRLPAATVLAWRDWLRKHEVRQPFKQAHREIYILTDAEVQTSRIPTASPPTSSGSISSRPFAGSAAGATTCRALGLHNVPTLPLPRFGLQAEFWVEALGEHGSDEERGGVYMQLATDQVRFTGAEGTPRMLSEVPGAGVLGGDEGRRSVRGRHQHRRRTDLGDRGDERARTYWQSYAFGDLTAAAQTRREVLAALLPKLKIASRCGWRESFLEVQGQLHTYKIHLGSANILMEPSGRYLCNRPRTVVRRPSERIPGATLRGATPRSRSSSARPSCWPESTASRTR